MSFITFKLPVANALHTLHSRMNSTIKSILCLVNARQMALALPFGVVTDGTVLNSAWCQYLFTREGYMYSIGQTNSNVKGTQRINMPRIEINNPLGYRI